MMGYYTEMKDPKNVDKTMQELKDMVLKNLAERSNLSIQKRANLELKV
jgi:hypothetical protein